MIKMRRTLQRTSNEGFTLAELLTSMALFMILSTIVVALVVTTLTNTARQNADNTNSRTLIVALENMGTYIKHGVKSYPELPVLLYQKQQYKSGSPAQLIRGRNNGLEMSFFAQTNNDLRGPTVIHFYLDGTNLIQEIITSDDTLGWNSTDYKTQNPQRRIIARNVVTPGIGDRPIFSYYQLGNSDPINNWSDPTQALGEYNTRAVAAVGISVTVRQDNSRGNRFATAENFAVLSGFTDLMDIPATWPETPDDPRPTPDGNTPPESFTPLAGAISGGGSSSGSSTVGVPKSFGGLA